MDSCYITSAQKPQQLPSFELPEVALIGRSNTGKSTLLNVLLGRKSLARTSRTPGRTQMVNFFKVDNRLIFADLPGYGFSKTNRSSRQFWQDLVEAYITRPNIRHLLFLVDCRRDLDDDDLYLMDWMGRNVELTVILTKADKLSKSAIAGKQRQLQQQLQKQGIPHANIRAVSSLKKTGVDELRQALFDE